MKKRQLSSTLMKPALTMERTGHFRAISRSITAQCYLITTGSQEYSVKCHCIDANASVESHTAPVQSPQSLFFLDRISL